MLWVHRSGIALALALAGCSSFVQAESEDSGMGGNDGSSGTSGASNATLNPSTSGATDSGSGGGGPGTTPVTSNSDTTGTDTTNPTSTDPSDTTDPTASSTAGDSTGGTDTTRPTSGTGEETGEETTGPKVCEPIDAEPNGSLKQALDLGEIPCGEMTYDFDGTIEDGGDEDWIEFLGDWTCGDPNPRVVVDALDDNVEVCVTPGCEADGTTFYFCVEGSNWNDGGDLGCCSTDRVEMNVNCNGDDESLVATIRVRNNKAVCEHYTVRYAFEVQ